MSTNCEPVNDDDYNDYIVPGTRVIMYVNAYAVTRHYGGPQEGGWWYNHKEPLASVPIKGKSHEGHEGFCYNCKMARMKELDDKGNPYNLCNMSFHLVANKKQANKIKKHLHKIYNSIVYGDIYSSTGGKSLDIAIEEFPAWEVVQESTIYE